LLESVTVMCILVCVFALAGLGGAFHGATLWMGEWSARIRAAMDFL